MILLNTVAAVFQSKKVKEISLPVAVLARKPMMKQKCSIKFRRT